MPISHLDAILATASAGLLLIITMLVIFTVKLRRRNAWLQAARDGSRRAMAQAKESAAEAERIRDRLAKIVRTAPVAYCLLVDGRVVECNEYYARTFGTPIGANVMEKYAGNENFAEFMRQLTRAEQVTGVLAYLNEKNGTAKRFACSAAKTVWENEPANVIWALDIEELERKKEEIAIAKQEALQDVIEKQMEASRLKSHFLMNISHELKTPMNAIIGLTELAKPSDEPDKLYQSIRQIGCAASVLLGIVDQVLDLSMIEEGRVSLRLQWADVREMVQKVVATMQPSADPRCVRIQVDDRALLHTRAMMDEARVCQVLMALLSNAIKFSPECADVFVSAVEEPTDAQRSCYRFTVKDSGPGIPPDKRDRIFEAFEHADNSITHQHGGIGLGLTIAQKLVHLMDGDITFESTLGKGSEFCFWVHAERDGATPGASDPSVDLSHLRALVVDDVDINRMVLMGQLEGLGIASEEAENGQVALEKVASTAPGYYDLVLMDIQMPLMDGYSATRAIRALPRQDVDGIVILAVSANSMPEDVRKSMDAGMDGHLAKPFYPEQLRQKLEDLMSR